MPWTGFDQQERDFLRREEAKDLWDWLGLLIVPAVIAAVGLWFNHTQKQTELRTAREHREQDRELARQEREQDRQLAEDRWKRDQELADQRREQDQKIADARRDQKIADKRRQQEQEIADAGLREQALQLYLDRMADLLLREHLIGSANTSPVRAVARARTLTVLYRLRRDGQRKGAVLRFLYQSQLLTSPSAVLDLRGADLSGAYLRGARLSDIDLADVKVRP